MTQLHPLAATISCPCFQISTSDIDFGTCFVGQEVSHLVTIVNRSGADTRWRARVESKSLVLNIYPDQKQVKND